MDPNDLTESDSDWQESDSDNEFDYSFMEDEGLSSGILEEPFSEEGGDLGSEILTAINTNTVSSYAAGIKEKGFKNHPVVIGLIGQANMCFAKRNFDEALRLCMEAIRIQPHSSDAYQTMSEIYEEVGEFNKALQLGMMAAATGPSDADRWIALADKAIELQKTQDAIFCYTRATKCNRQLYEVYLRLLKLYDPSKDKKSITLIYQQLVRWAPVNLGAKILEYAQLGAKLLLEESEAAGALSLMEKAFERVSSSVTDEHVNLIVELYLQLFKFEECLQVISKYCNVTIEGEKDIVAAADNPEEYSSTALRVTDCIVDGELAPEIRAKLAIVLIHLKAFYLMDAVVEPLLNVIEEYGDLLVDIVEVLMSSYRYADALKLLQLLLQCDNFSLPQVWWLYANCLRHLERKEEAVSAYLTVMDKAPQYADARLIVSELLNELGRDEEALTALSQDPNSKYLNIGVLYERCLLLKSKPEKVDEFLAMGRLLLSRHCARFRNRKEYNTFIRYNNGRWKHEALKFDPEEPIYVEGKKMPTFDEEFKLFVDLCNAALESNNFHTLQRMTCSAMNSKVLNKNTERMIQIHAMAALGAFFNKDPHASHIFFKNLVANGFDCARTWNAYNLIATQADTVAQQKYIVRQLSHKPSHFALPLIFANNCFTNGIYKQALSEYLLQFKHQPSPFLALMIAITCLHLAMQHNKKGVNALVAQAMGFMSEYKQMRGPACLQEVHYNLGRLNHQLGLLPPALHHYKQVLEIPAPCEMFDLKKEAAFNISLIYQKSQSYDLARYYIDKYIVI